MRKKKQKKLTPEELELFTQKVIEAMMKDMNKRWGFSPGESEE